MFTADTLIDTVQTGKKTLLNTYVQNEAVKESLVKFIDAQSDYTKKAAKVTLDTMTALSSEATKQMQEAVKFDWAKATQTWVDSFKPVGAKK